MKTKKKSLSVIYTIICAALSVAMVLSLVEIFNASYIKIAYGDSEYTEVAMQSERNDIPFEDSELFARIVIDETSDIIRSSVISNQMESKGSYDAKKKVDISAYASRHKGYSAGMPTAIYYLDDLVKWGNYGFDYREVTGTKAQLDTFFYALKIGDDRLAIDSSEAVHDELNDDDMFIDDTDVASDAQTMYILVDRYKSAENCSLLDYASDREEYEVLVRNLRASARELFMNYSEYDSHSDAYSADKCNLRYCIQLDNGDGKTVRFTNLSQSVTGLTNDEINALFTAEGRYACFNPSKLQLVTNIEAMSVEVLNEIVKQYGYVFMDASRVWIAVDTSYPVTDICSVARQEYSRNSDMFVPSMFALFIGLILYLLIFIIMTIQAGKCVEVDEEGNKESVVRMEKVDHMPVEVWLVITAVAALLLMTLVGETLASILDVTDIFVVTLCAEAVLVNIIMLPLYLILVRKIKCRHIWNGSLLQALCNKIRATAVGIYDNGRLITRTWLPFMLFLAINLVLVLLGIWTTIIAFILDLLVGYWLYTESKTRGDIVEGIRSIAGGNLKHKIDTDKMHGDNLILADSVNSIGEGIREAVETSMKDEKMKADLITNVSHDIKTPLTSIINYVDLIKRENIDNERVAEYVDVLDKKSQRLKQLIDDLVEASKISSGNISFTIDKINFVELLNQAMGEFSERFEAKSLNFMLNFPSEPVYIMADSRGLYRVIENLFINLYKYAMDGTRVYMDVTTGGNKVTLSIRNISADALGVSADDLTERFIRGDKSRGTEGSGLGLSIAKSLTEALDGTFDIVLDGDLFKTIISFDTVAAK